jgi:RNA polymerase sigma-70 factor (ECF subfamily)
MQLRSDKSKQEKFHLLISDAAFFMETSSVLHPIDENEPDLEKGLADCIGKLKQEQKECIQQFYYGNRCYQEIAENMGLDEKKVKSHLQNAKRNLKLCLEEKHVRQK